MGRPYSDLLETVCLELELELSDLQKEQLLGYTNLIIEGLRKKRLVGETGGDLLIRKHMFDSLYPLGLGEIPPGTLLDLGTGAGLPGIPLKICLPEHRLYLLDANKGKINFLRRVCLELNLKKVFYLPGRAEEWGRDPGCRERFDCVVSRAVARAAVLAELGLPLVKRGGCLLLYKGSKGPAEVEEAETSLRLCGGMLKKNWRYRLPTGEERTLFLIDKKRATPAAYPRGVGKPARKPLGG